MTDSFGVRITGRIHILFFLYRVTLPFCHIFQSFLETGDFHGLFLVFLYAGMDLIFIDKFPEQEHLQEGDQVGQQVIITQSGGKVVEESQEHHRHGVHNKFHARLGCTSHHLVVELGI